MWLNQAFSSLLHSTKESNQGTQTSVLESDLSLKIQEVTLFKFLAFSPKMPQVTATSPSVILLTPQWEMFT